MMGSTHVLTGPALAIVILPAVNAVAPHLGQHPIHGVGLLPCLVASAGGAMVPDMDHPSATVAQTLGPVSKYGIAMPVHTVSGGHREGTHSIVGIAVAGALTWVLSHSHVVTSHIHHTMPSWLGVGLDTWVYGAWLGFLLAVASAAMFRGFNRRSALVHLAAVVAGTVGIVWLLVHTAALPQWTVVVGVGIGALAHVLGDMLTKDGCPLLWPFSRVRFRFPGAAHRTTEQGSKLENRVSAVSVLVFCVGMALELHLFHT